MLNEHPFVSSHAVADLTLEHGVGEVRCQETAVIVVVSHDRKLGRSLLRALSIKERARGNKSRKNQT